VSSTRLTLADWPETSPSGAEPNVREGAPSPGREDLLPGAATAVSASPGPQPPPGAATEVPQPTVTASRPVARPMSEALRRQVLREVARDFERISVDRQVKAGEPTVAGTKITLAQIYDLASEGRGIPGIVEEFYGEITEEDVRDAFRFAAKLVS
jgi:uncharacterized protein (DUF433 family)